MDMGTAARCAGKPASQREKGISGSTIKLIGIITMFIDHLAASLLTRMVIDRDFFTALYHGEMGGFLQRLAASEWLYPGIMFLRLVGRLGFPIFCFLLTEGFFRTRSRFRYAVRLGLFALISEVPFDLAFSGRVLEFQHQNVYFTLFLGMLVMCACAWLEDHRPPAVLTPFAAAFGILLSCAWLAGKTHGRFGLDRLPYILIYYAVLCLAAALALALYGVRRGLGRAGTLGADLAVLGAAMLAAEALKTDYAGLGVLTILVMYVAHNAKAAAMALGCAVLTLFNISEITAFFAVIPVADYNGRRGWKLKYFFYVFYPAHLFLLWLAAWFLGLGSVPVI